MISQIKLKHYINRKYSNQVQVQLIVDKNPLHCSLQNFYVSDLSTFKKVLQLQTIGSRIMNEQTEIK